MTWIIFAAVSYFLNAVTAVIDKFLLGKRIPSPTAYTFYVGILSIFALILVPLGFEWPGVDLFISNITAGVVFLLFILLFITAVKRDEVSRVVTIVFGLAPVFAFILNFLIFQKQLSRPQVLAFIMLVIGGTLMSYKKSQKTNKYSLAGLRLTAFAALVYAAYSVWVDYLLKIQPFNSGFIWTRLGSFIGALVLLLPLAKRQEIFAAKKRAGQSGSLLFVVNKILAGIAFIFLNKALSLGNSALVTATQGFQYIFLFLLVAVLTNKFPNILKEKFSRIIILQKALAITIIALGLVFLYS